MNDEKRKNSEKKEYVRAEMEKMIFSEKDIITYSWDENVPDDGWQPF